MAPIPRSQPHPRNFRTGQELGRLIGGPGCCCVACPVSADLDLFCPGAIGLLGIAAGQRYTSIVYLEPKWLRRRQGQ